MHRRLVLVSAASALVVLSLVLVLLQGRSADAEETRSTSVTGAQAAQPPASDAPSASPSPAPSASPTPTPAPAADAPRQSPSPSAPSEPAPQRKAKADHVAAADAPLAGRIKPDVTYSGVATFYGTDGSGACLYDAGSDVMTAAMNTADYETAKACGAYVRVQSGGKSITVRITNECPGDCAVGQLDLSAEAFAQLAEPSKGRIPITWNLVSPSDLGTLSVRYKSGSSQYWCGIQAIGHRNPLARLEVQVGGGWKQLTRTTYNYFLSEDGSGCGGPIRLTDIYGEQLTVEGLTIRPDVTQSTRVQFARR
ncbi:expansin EXLX1 family cellulose-binding protein [Streptomyces sp. NPDC091279]|uniref:expansin EXLX1 family cellulose-binding protein n=1 Tax=Streptomyces sp. NPDC091279 TaxID=3365983 RepID=UPI003821CA7D